MIFRDVLPELWSCYLFNEIRNKDGYVYGQSFLNKNREYSKKWIENKKPKKSSIRLWSKNKCVFCNIPLFFKISVGDHSVGKGLDELCWALPCCKKCNSSKGTTKINRDLITWWIEKKQKNIIQLNRDVLSIFLRARWRLLQIDDNLDIDAPYQYNIAINQLKNAWTRNFNLIY